MIGNSDVANRFLGLAAFAGLREVAGPEVWLLPLHLGSKRSGHEDANEKTR